MLSKINLACVGALTLLPHLAVAADATLPTANVESMCKLSGRRLLPAPRRRISSLA
jgi:hypothetical protein